MSITKNIIKKLSRTESNLGKIAAKAIRDNKKFVLSTLKHDQLGEGLDSSGRVVGTYAAATEEVWAKRSPKPRTSKKTGEPYNFEWTGGFFDSMKVNTENEGYDITSSRKSELESAYGTNLTKFTEENSEFINEKVIVPALYEAIFASLDPFK